jgi:hypothetical protein
LLLGIALKAKVTDEKKKKATYNDLTTHLEEGTFLPDRKNRKFGDNQGYSITDKTNIDQFITALKADFETYILPGLEEPKTLGDLVKFYERFPFWGDNLKKVIGENKLTIQ